MELSCLVRFAALLLWNSFVALQWLLVNQFTGEANPMSCKRFCSVSAAVMRRICRIKLDIFSQSLYTQKVEFTLQTDVRNERIFRKTETSDIREIFFIKNWYHFLCNQ